tara:strand:+ start:1948 stop:2211 length:264 start_codon:yes stop_codon:yes gene_type:complete
MDSSNIGIVLDNSDIMNYIYEYNPKQYTVYEGDNYHDLEHYMNRARVNDEIYYMTYNQLGCKMYKVKKNGNNKYLDVIWCADDDYFD